jgi:hypothetical protein
MPPNVGLWSMALQKSLERAGLVLRQRRTVGVAETPSQSVRHPLNL